MVLRTEKAHARWKAARAEEKAIIFKLKQAKRKTARRFRVWNDLLRELHL